MKQYDPTTQLDDVLNVADLMKKLAAVYLNNDLAYGDVEIKVENGRLHYPIGTITFDPELDTWAFTAHDDNSETS